MGNDLCLDLSTHDRMLHLFRQRMFHKLSLFATLQRRADIDRAAFSRDDLRIETLRTEEQLSAVGRV